MVFLKKLKMKTITKVAYVSLISLFGFSSCTENPHDNDPTSTITPGNKLEVDSATAHTNNSFDAKTNARDKTDSSSNSNNHNSGSNNLNSGTKGNDNVKPAGSNSNINTNDNQKNPK